MLQNEVLRQVLEAKGLNFDEVMQEVMTEQKIVNLMRTVGKSVAEIIGEGYATIEVHVSEGKVQVSVSGSLRSRQIEFDISHDDNSGQESRKRDGKGTQIVKLLDEACQRFGISLKEWQKRSIAYHFPQIAKSLLRETRDAIGQDEAFREAIEAYRQWHPERAGELPQI